MELAGAMQAIERLHRKALAKHSKPLVVDIRSGEPISFSIGGSSEEVVHVMQMRILVGGVV